MISFVTRGGKLHMLFGVLLRWVLGIGLPILIPMILRITTMKVLMVVLQIPMKGVLFVRQSPHSVVVFGSHFKSKLLNVGQRAPYNALRETRVVIRPRDLAKQNKRLTA